MEQKAAQSSNTPLVSVYCMTYNQENTIGETIESILAQKTDFPFELIVHDDASTDRTPEIIAHYAKAFPEIVRPIFQKENQYFNCNLIKTFIHPAGRGAFVALCEGDDYWTDPEKLQRQADHMVANPECMLCFHAVQQLEPDGRLINYRPLKVTGRVDPSLIVRRGGMFCPTVSCMFRREVMDTWPRFRDEADVYDYPAQVLAVSMGNVFYMDRIMGVYRFASEGSWTAQHMNEVQYKHIENETRWLQLFDEDTNRKFSYDIQYHLAHMWFTEYRKTFDPQVRTQALVYIKKLSFVDRTSFILLILFFSIMGRKANRFWQWMKKILLR